MVNIAKTESIYMGVGCCWFYPKFCFTRRFLKIKCPNRKLTEHCASVSYQKIIIVASFHYYVINVTTMIRIWARKPSRDKRWNYSH